MEENMRIYSKGIAKPIPQLEGETLEDTCKRIALENEPMIDQRDVGEECDYENWQHALTWYSEWDGNDNHITTNNDYFIYENTLYMIVEKEESKVQNKYNVNKADDGTIEFEMEFTYSEDEDIYDTVSALTGYLEN